MRPTAAKFSFWELLLSFKGPKSKKRWGFLSSLRLDYGATYDVLFFNGGFEDSCLTIDIPVKKTLCWNPICFLVYPVF